MCLSYEWYRKIKMSYFIVLSSYWTLFRDCSRPCIICRFSSTILAIPNCQITGTWIRDNRALSRMEMQRIKRKNQPCTQFSEISARTLITWMCLLHWQMKVVKGMIGRLLRARLVLAGSKPWVVCDLYCLLSWLHRAHALQKSMNCGGGGITHPQQKGGGRGKEG